MSSRANCCVPNCNSVYKNNPELTFHHFPNDGQKIQHTDEFGVLSKVDRKTIWEVQLKMGKPVTKNMRVCSRHFVEDDFLTPGDWIYKKRYLKKTAVPSKNLPLSCITAKSVAHKQEGKIKRLERLTKRTQNIENSRCSSELLKKTDMITDTEGAKILLELANVYKQEVTVVDEDICMTNSSDTKKFVNIGTQTDEQKEMKNAETQANLHWSSFSDFIKYLSNTFASFTFHKHSLSVQGNSFNSSNGLKQETQATETDSIPP